MYSQIAGDRKKFREYTLTMRCRREHAVREETTVKQNTTGLLLKQAGHIITLITLII